MRRRFHRIVGLLLLTALAPACKPKAPPQAAPAPVGVPAPPARDVSGPEHPQLSNPDLVKVFTSRGLDAREEGAGVVIYLPTVYLFAFNKSEVDPGARTQLKEIATLLAEPMLAGRRGRDADRRRRGLRRRLRFAGRCQRGQQQQTHDAVEATAHEVLRL